MREAQGNKCSLLLTSLSAHREQTHRESRKHHNEIVTPFIPQSVPLPQGEICCHSSSATAACLQHRSLSRDYQRNLTHQVSWGCLNSKPLKDVFHPCSQVIRWGIIWPRRFRGRGRGGGFHQEIWQTEKWASCGKWNNSVTRLWW